MAIIKLDRKTIEKIAAGEVIESPFSVVKELLENSIDAGAKNISVEIKNGGKSYIRVTDDGIGIKNDEIELAFSKHATSKIDKFDDLYTLNSLGFRGEALSSIASVSNVVAISKNRSDKLGLKLKINDSLKGKTPVASNVGTSIIVKDLFYNMPARRKFLASDITEANKITKLLYAFAIGYDNISFKYIKDDSIIFQSYSNTELKLKISDLLDSSLYENLLTLNKKADLYDIRAYISSPNYYRGNRSMEYIFVNNRLVENSEISRVIEEQYRSYIPNNRFPAFFLFVKTEAKNIDVNIHPNKKLVKFSYEDKLLELISSMVSEKLSKSMSTNRPKFEEKHKDSSLNFNDYKSILDKFSPVDTTLIVREEDEDYNDDDFFLAKEDIQIEEVKDHIDDSEIINNYSNLSFLKDKDRPSYKCSILKRYSIFEGQDKILILDHRRADEKIKTTQFIDDFNNSSISKQTLLDPIIITLSSNDIDKYMLRKEFIESMGIESDLLTDNTVIIRKLPYIFESPENKQFFYELLDLDLSTKDKYIYKNIRKLIKSLSFKRGSKIDKNEADYLYDKLMQEKNPYQNYDGLSTIIEIDSKDLEKYFDR